MNPELLQIKADACTNFRFIYTGMLTGRLQHGDNPEHALVIDHLGETPSVVDWHRAIVARMGDKDCAYGAGQ